VFLLACEQGEDWGGGGGGGAGRGGGFIW